LEELPDHAPDRRNDTTMMTSGRSGSRPGVETRVARVRGPPTSPVTSTLSSATAAVRYPSPPGVALNLRVVTIHRVAQQLDGVLTGCALAIAETGTIVLDGAGGSGRRALTLVPDYHLCVVRSVDIVPSVPDSVVALASVAAEGRPITLVSGPSATVDIELVRVEGVHGPRTLDVFVIEP